jgi:lincosamide nucleotidyltransferase A/C/D/E
VTTDWLPVRIELSDSTSHVDLHPLHYLPDGSAWQSGIADARFDYPADCWVVGRIAELDDICLSAARQRAFHTGYELSDVDHDDLAVIDDLERGH